MDHDIELYYSTALEIAKSSGELIKDAYSKEKRVQTKATVADLVTETDELVEQIVRKTVSTKFPTHKFIGEESCAAGEKCNLTDEPTWVIDPIDGTSNFVHRFPFSAISIGFLMNKEAVFGIVYNPMRDELFTARKGQGAFCNGVKLECTKTKELGQALVCAEFGSGRDQDKLDSKFRTMRKIINKAHGIRSVGSAAISMSMVAAGYVDGYYEAGIHCWDIAAGELIVREAGGIVLDLKGGPLDLLNRRVLCAGTEQLAKELAELIEDIEYERD